MLNRILRLVAVLSGCLSLAACDQTHSENSMASLSQSPVVEFRLAIQANPNNKAWEASHLFKEELQRRSGGRVRVVFYDSGVLGDERHLLEACHLGIVEMVQITSSKASTLDPQFNLLDMPYLFIDDAHHQRVLNGPIGQALLDGLRPHGLQGLGFYGCGFRSIFNTQQRAIKKPEDLAGMKIRVMSSPVMVDSINAMGASATPLSASEVFQSLKTGLVDGAENNPGVFVSEKFYEAEARHFSLTRHFANQHALIANRHWLDRLKKTHPEIEQMIRETAKAIVPMYNRRWNASVTESMQKIKEQGVHVNEVDDVLPFVNKVEPIYDAFFQRYPQVPRKLLLRIRQEAKR